MENEILIKKVISAFDNLRLNCNHTINALGHIDNDCNHPEIEFDCICCCLNNCPLFLEYELSNQE
jgi:hypothetical protein